jgi:ribonuclease T2
MMARNRMQRLAMLAGVIAFPGLALAQNQCVIPQSLPQSRALFPPPGRTVVAPLTGHILALSWSPQFCKERGDESKNASQCSGPGKFGFVLHGLWPDGAGQNDPQWCKRVPPVSVEVMKQYFCATPSAGLMQYEWAKHGSCIERDAEHYFRAASRLYAALNFPDMEALSRSQTDVAAFRTAFIAVNPGLSADMVRVDVTQLGWLKEVRLCLARDYHPIACPRDIGGDGADTKLKIWPAR